MGLYKLITENFLKFQQNDASFHGLLNHAEHILRSARFSSKTDEPFTFFSSFVEELGFSKVCILLSDENLFKMYFSYGFDSSSFQKSISTKDFWDGTVTTEEWIQASDEDIVPFRQLFSEDDNAEISLLHIKRFELNETSCIMIIAEHTKQTLVDTDMVDVVLPSLFPHINHCIETKRIISGALFATKFETAVNTENSLIENANGYMFTVSLDNFFNSFDYLSTEAALLLFKSLHYSINILTKLPDIIYADDHTIKIIRFCNGELDQELYAYQLKKTISPIFSPEKADLIEIKCEGSSSDINDLIDFLQR